MRYVCLGENTFKQYLTSAADDRRVQIFEVRCFMLQVMQIKIIGNKMIVGVLIRLGK